MEVPALPPRPTKDYSSSVDMSRPFLSVKEAVAIFYLEKYILQCLIVPLQEKTQLHGGSSHQVLVLSKTLKKMIMIMNKNEVVLGTLKKLKTELEETKAELKLRKERGSETEMALASLNAELGKNMSKLAKAVGFEREKREDLLIEEEKRKELLKRMENSPTLSQILTLGEESGYFGGNRKAKKVVKKKPIAPLLGDLFFRKKGSSNNTLNNHLIHLMKCILIKKTWLNMCI